MTEVVLTALFLFVILGVDRHPGAEGLRAARDRAGADADPPDEHPGHQHLGEPGALDRAGAVRRRRRDLPAVAVHRSRRSRAPLVAGLTYTLLFGGAEPAAPLEAATEG